MSDPMPRHDEGRSQDAEHARGDYRDELGAEGGSTSAPDVATPFSPNDQDDSPLGDTDQHSDA